MEALADDIIIPIKGLPKGESAFDFAIGGKFFQKFGNTVVKDADCSIKVRLQRQSAMISASCSMGGFVVVECDRCLDDLAVKVDVERVLTIGLGSVDVDEDSDPEDVIVVSPSDREISLDQFVYDYICVNLPLVKVHPEGKCNPDMERRLKEYMK